MYTLIFEIFHQITREKNINQRSSPNIRSKLFRLFTSNFDQPENFTFNNQIFYFVENVEKVKVIKNSSPKVRRSIYESPCRKFGSAITLPLWPMRKIVWHPVSKFGRKPNVFDREESYSQATRSLSRTAQSRQNRMEFLQLIPFEMIFENISFSDESRAVWIPSSTDMFYLPNDFHFLERCFFF